jgi:preprotein translocase subunit SecG
MVELPLALGGVMMDILKVIVTVVYVLICIALVIVVLMQEGKSAGLGAIGGGTSETYWGKNKGRSMEGALEKFTKALAIAFILLSVILNLL